MLDSNSLFSESFYLQRYSDVAEAVANGTVKSGLEHFNQFGKFESRSSSAFFDQSLYLNQNLDVAQALQNKTITSAFDHYINFGQKEGRDASFIFNNAYYLSKNSDVAAAVGRDELTGIEHFVKYGVTEGRSSSKGFDVRQYLESNTDLKTAGFSNSQAVDHFMAFGVDEGRRPNDNFDVDFYFRRNPDLRAAGLTNRQAFQHMITNGMAEKRSGAPGVPGLVAAGSNGNRITMGVKYISTTEPSVVGVCNPGMSLANGTNECPIFTEPSVVGAASTFFPNTGNPQESAAPWTFDNTSPSLTVANNSNYAITRVVYGNAFPVEQPNFLISDLENSGSDIFNSITYDAAKNEMTIDSAGNTGILPGKSWTIQRFFTVPENLVNQAIKESALLTFTPA